MEEHFSIWSRYHARIELCVRAFPSCFLADTRRSARDRSRRTSWRHARRAADVIVQLERARPRRREASLSMSPVPCMLSLVTHCIPLASLVPSCASLSFRLCGNDDWLDSRSAQCPRLLCCPMSGCIISRWPSRAMACKGSEVVWAHFDSGHLCGSAASLSGLLPTDEPLTDATSLQGRHDQIFLCARRLSEPGFDRALSLVGTSATTSLGRLAFHGRIVSC